MPANLSAWKIPPIPVQVQLAYAKAVAPSILKSLRRGLKYVFFLLLLVNARSLPLAWHVRIFRPVVYLRLQYYLLRLHLLFSSKEVKVKASNDWAESLSPVGAHPFEMTTVYKTWASLDESDFNGHLSNSSYAKTLDAARFKTALASFPAFFRSGGWMALGATHYHFIREIPMFARYEVRVTIGGWDNKWIYVICRFVSKSQKKGRSSDRQESPTPSPPPGSMSSTLQASLHTPVNADELGTPLPNTPAGLASVPSADNVAVMNVLQRTEEPDGATLHCVSISTMCFKQGRITVPPGVIIAAEGFSRPPSAGSSDPSPSTSSPTASSPVNSYSRANPPPTWALSQSLRLAPTGSMRTFREFLKGGWRNVPEGQRWWEDALGGEIEERRKAAVEVLGLARKGLEETRELR
ncbi:hypothetical protein SERLA73DRAFT_192050 [Serpula lacrymans var. lacrymans S7.3]|uniref:Thioesterase domain-containing protein n=2 Tax=Serpula lacrymans var. lacrymans TaxID=341189 RepID=F8QIU8_SERL3|nr:uncharacterized protein SERLADRAFT_459811 [Serpula lacrymans var. lacrymans S7.9]EGN91776.1 hypothetical protein SERLA73DRAFT_192050 [Serpula lacrymans var. lacrymans S7.3]EGO28919.1 hypothetical protein SERLADRAFT_459811 [Serpula lacrymans var. lacrymans S7.9]